MRMFLVVMCDMFLLLYLTALAQIEETPVSNLTVKDYLALKKAEEEVRHAAESKDRDLADRRRENAELEARLRELEEKMKKAAQSAASEKQKLAATIQNTSASLEEAKRRQAEEAKAAEQLRIAAAEQEQRFKAETAKAEAERKRLEELQTAREKEAAELKREAEDAAKRAEEAKAEAERARQAAKRSVDDAAKASEEKTRALELARAAQEREQSAMTTAALANADAERAKTEAAQANAIAVHVQKEKKQIAERMKAVTQRAESAYQKNVRGKLLRISSEVETKNLLIGRTARKLVLSGLAVNLSGESVVVVPLEQLGIEPGRNADDYTQLRLTIEGNEIRRAYVSPRSPQLVALVLPRAVPTGGSVGPEVPLASLMPTLIALRNGSDLEFRDRIRGLDGERYVFQRDRLRDAAGGLLTYETSGFRGTGDFGERILKGDQIVDLEGNFIGVALDDGKILRAPNLRDWKEVTLDSGTAAGVVRALR